MKNSLDPVDWVVGGDFNSTRNHSERIGKSGTSKMGEMEEFNKFIGLMKLVDVPAIANHFTWFGPNGKACSTCDRFLVCHGIVDKWKILAQEK